MDFIQFETIDESHPSAAVSEDEEMFFGTEDTKPELYAPKNKENVEFDRFEGYQKSIKKFMDTLQNVENNDNPFFDSTSYGLVCNIMVGRVNLEKNDIDDTFRGLITERKVKPKKKKKKSKVYS